MNNKLINDKKTNIDLSIISFTEKKLRELFPESDPNPVFPEVDPLIWIHIKMKWIRSTGF